MLVKSSARLLLVLWVCLVGCRQEEPTAIDTWAQNCVQLSPDPEGYRLTGLCCAYIIIPRLTLRTNQPVSVDAQYVTSTGAGYTRLPIRVNGQLSADGRVLAINYTIDGTTTSYRLEPGIATMYCHCAPCD